MRLTVCYCTPTGTYLTLKPKFYKDIALAVVGKLEKSKLTLKLWYVLRDKAPRRGLLIRKRPKTK